MVAAAAAVLGLPALTAAIRLACSAGLCLLAAVALAAVVAVIAAAGTLAVLAGALAATAAVGASGLALGTARGRCRPRRGRPFPAVVGLPLAQAQAAFQRARTGPIRDRAGPLRPRGTVLRATGYSTDGSYGPGSTITLVVGSGAHRSAASSAGG